MADSDKNIIITPHRGATSQPNIVFTGQGNDPITVRVLDGTTGTGLTAGGALSFEGSAGQLFSVVNRLGTGSIFSVNDISGIPSLDVDANGTVEIAPFTGYVAIGLTLPTEKLHVVGNILTSGSVNAFGGISASSGTFASNITVNSVSIGRGEGNDLSNTAIGSGALGSNTTGQSIVAIGRQALNASVTGSDNIAIGRRSLFSLISGNSNVAIGAVAAISFRGSNIVAIGSEVLHDLVSGTGGIYIGAYANSSGGNTIENEIVIGPSTTGLGSNTTIIGPSTQTLARINGLLDAPSGISASGISSGSYILTSAGIKSLTGTTYTFLASDNGDVLTHNNASGCTLTVPAGLPVGYSTTLIRLNSTGKVAFIPASGVTLNSYGGFTALSGQHASASLISYETNVYNLSGNLI